MQNDKKPASVTVEHVTTPTWMTSMMAEPTARADLLFLPRTVREGRGEYPAADLLAVKALRAQGVDVDWAHSGPERTFASEYTADAAIAVSLFVVQALSEEGAVVVARWLLGRIRQVLTGMQQRTSDPPVVVEVARFTANGERREIEGLRVTGQDERIVEAVASLLRGEPPPR